MHAILNLRKWMLVLSSFCCLNVLSQQTNLSGIVSIFNSETQTGKRQYVSNAQIWDDFNKAQPTITNRNGQFNLIYIGINQNASVSFQVKKTGLEVVNKDALYAIAGQHDVVRISMANPDSIVEYRRMLYEIGKTQAEKKLEYQIKVINQELFSLRKSRLQNDERIKQLQQHLATMEDQKGNIEKQAQDLARKYAPVDLDDASPLFRHAFTLFQSGNLDSAQRILNQADLPGKVVALLIEERRIEERQNELKERKFLKDTRKEEYAQGLQLKADLHTASYEFDSASFTYQLLISLDSQNTEHLFAYANFLAWLNQYDKAISHLETILVNTGKISSLTPSTCVPVIASVYDNLGSLYSAKNLNFKAEAAYKKALEIGKCLVERDPQTYERMVAETLNNMGALYSKNKDDTVKSVGAYMAALRIYLHLAKEQPVSFQQDIAMVQNNLGNLYTDRNLFEKAEIAYLSGLEILEGLAKNDSLAYESDIALALSNLGSLYRLTKNLYKAEEVFKRALRIRRRLVKYNPQTFEPELASTLNNLGNLYSVQKDYDNAEITLQEALQIRKRLGINNPETYEPLIAKVQTNLGNVYFNKGDFLKSQLLFEEALTSIKSLAIISPRIYEPVVAETHFNIAMLFSLKKDYVNAELAYHEALQIYKRLIKSDPPRFEPLLVRMQNNLGYLYFLTKNSVKAEIYLIQALRGREKLRTKYPGIYTPEAIITSKLLIEYYTSILDSLKYDTFNVVEQDSLKAVDQILSNHAEIDTALAIRISSYYGNRSWYLLFASKFQEAEQFARKAILIKPENTWIKVNLAHSLLLQGKYRKASEVYLELKTRRDTEGNSYAAVCLDDLSQLEQHRITHQDIKKIRALLR